MSMYKLFEYSDNYSMTSWSLWNYYRGEMNDAAKENDAVSNKINNGKITTRKFFESQASIIENRPANSKGLYEVVV